LLFRTLPHPILTARQGNAKPLPGRQGNPILVAESPAAALEQLRTMYLKFGRQKVCWAIQVHVGYRIPLPKRNERTHGNGV
jgi:hypothetical protein